MLNPTTDAKVKEYFFVIVLKRQNQLFRSFSKRRTLLAFVRTTILRQSTEPFIFYLDGEVKLIYGKTKPFVVGDGKSTVGELVEELNLPDKSVVKDNLKDLDLTYVPTVRENVDISWKHNLSGGAKPTILPKGELYTQIEQLAIRAGKAMNINFATIDVIETTDGSLYVLEINSGIGATIFTELVDGGTEIIKDIYRQAVKKLFQ